MIRICEICNKRFDTKSSTRIYCYECGYKKKLQRLHKT